MAERLSETARGRWHGILPQLGISAKLLRNRHGPCPMCGGKDRFRFDDRDGKGTWICNRCGSGDGAELVKRIKGVEYKEAAKMVEAVVVRAPSCSPLDRRQMSKKDLVRLWDEAVPIRPETAAGYYFKARCGISENYPDSLRQINYGNFTTIVAKVTNKDGAGVSLHKTLIRGYKVESRLVTPGKLPDNVAIRLSPFTSRLGIAEGIETALSASVLFNVPVWAAISAPLLKKWRPPPGLEKVIIFGDNDENFTGQEAAYSLARLLSNDVEVEVKIPSIPGWDWNDVHGNNLDNR